MPAIWENIGIRELSYSFKDNVKLDSSLIQLESSLIELESSLNQFKSSLIEL